MENKKQKLSSALMLEGIRAWEISIKPAWHRHRGLVEGLGAFTPAPHLGLWSQHMHISLLPPFLLQQRFVSREKHLSGLWDRGERLHPTAPQALLQRYLSDWATIRGIYSPFVCLWFKI